MSGTGRDDEPLSPAQERLHGHLVLLREDAPTPGTSLVRVVVARARWQRTIRDPARAAGRLLAALVAGLGMIVGLRRGGEQ